MINNWNSLLPLFSSIVIISLGFFVWLKQPKVLLYILFFLYTFTASIWLFGTFMLLNATVVNDQIWWDHFIYNGVVFIPIFLYHFGLIYSQIKRQKILLYFGYSLAIIFLPLSKTDYFLKDLYHYQWGVHTIAQTWHHIFLIYFSLYFILFFVNLLSLYKKSKGEAKRQVKFLLISSAVLDIIGPLAFLPAYRIPIHPIIFLSTIPFTITLSYAIIRYRLFNVRFVLHKLFAEIITTCLVIISSFLIAYGSKVIVRLFNSSVYEQIVFIITLTTCLLIFQKHSQRFLTRINSKCGLNLYQPEELVISEEVQGYLQKLHQSLVKYFQDNFNIPDPILCIYNWKENYFQSIYHKPTLSYPQDNPITNLTKDITPVVAYNQLTTAYNLSDQDILELKILFKKNKINYAVGLKSQDNICGFVLIPNKYNLTELQLKELAKVRQGFSASLLQLLSFEMIVKGSEKEEEVNKYMGMQ